MIAVIQRAKEASVKITGTLKSSISTGLVVLLGIEDRDSNEDIEWLARKIVNLRIFDDPNGVMNLSSLDINGELLVVSQFTLQASVKKGNRPSYTKAARPEIAIPLYESFLQVIELENNGRVYSGEFGAEMEVFLINDGPVTIIIDTKDRK